MQALPWKAEELQSCNLSILSLLVSILKRRYWIRKHRDQKGDDRCWIDIFWFYPFFIDSPPIPSKLPEEKRMMEKCWEFFHYMGEEFMDPKPTVTRMPRLIWNIDLLEMTKEELLRELIKIQLTTKLFLSIVKRPRTTEDCRSLYSILPEHKSVRLDFRLPPINDFLGENQAPHAGCPSFWRSHEDCWPCYRCNIHGWGPCHH